MYITTKSNVILNNKNLKSIWTCIILHYLILFIWYKDSLDHVVEKNKLPPKNNKNLGLSVRPAWVSITIKSDILSTLLEIQLSFLIVMFSSVSSESDLKNFYQEKMKTKSINKLIRILYLTQGEIVSLQGFLVSIEVKK